MGTPTSSVGKMDRTPCALSTVKSALSAKKRHTNFLCAPLARYVTMATSLMEWSET